ncbi:helix-turn-helix transcriptional regulator [Jongsikchunia kroppenstedtii]|uniref:helix-turn-helix transcriptional regulator n=1 Tax=Jongsikchunia kroppenstedtii TaxID=1121721 RepID=UPI00036A88B8|nr:YafY family protein [Jongsikchunia kroppenstedtii]
MNAGGARLNRMLAMVPYFLAHPGASAEQAAQDLGTSSKQIMKDLEQLWLCGLPGYTPGDLIDLAFTEDSVAVTFSAGIDRPLRLTAAEAAPMLVALRALLDMPGVVDRSAARSAIAKIEAAVGGLIPTAVQSATSDGEADGDAESDGPAELVRGALLDGRALSMRYYSATRDTVSDRVVDPIRISAIGDHSYLEAWSREAGSVRLFRFDRMDRVQVLDEPAQVPSDAVEAEASVTALFDADPAVPSVQVDIDPREFWVLDYYLIEPLDQIEDHPADQPIRAQMSYGSIDWMVRFLAGFGGRIRVVDRPDIAEQVQARAAAALELYSNTAAQQ